jgi:hypothetical protein
MLDQPIVWSWPSRSRAALVRRPASDPSPVGRDRARPSTAARTGASTPPDGGRTPGASRIPSCMARPRAAWTHAVHNGRGLGGDEQVRGMTSAIGTCLLALVGRTTGSAIGLRSRRCASRDGCIIGIGHAEESHPGSYEPVGFAGPDSWRRSRRQAPHGASWCRDRIKVRAKTRHGQAVPVVLGSRTVPCPDATASWQVGFPRNRDRTALTRRLSCGAASAGVMAPPSLGCLSPSRTGRATVLALPPGAYARGRATSLERRPRLPVGEADDLWGSGQIRRSDGG